MSEKTEWPSLASKLFDYTVRTALNDEDRYLLEKCIVALRCAFPNEADDLATVYTDGQGQPKAIPQAQRNHGLQRAADHYGCLYFNPDAGMVGRMKQRYELDKLLPRERLKHLRGQRKLSLSKLAGASDITKCHLHDLESGRAQLSRVAYDTLVLLASTLGVTVHDIMR